MPPFPHKTISMGPMALLQKGNEAGERLSVLFFIKSGEPPSASEGETQKKGKRADEGGSEVRNNSCLTRTQGRRGYLLKA